EVQAIVVISVPSAFEVTCSAVRDPASHGNYQYGIVSHPVQKAAASDIRHAGKENQFGDVASIQRQLDNPLVVHDCSQAAAVCFDKGSVCLNFDLIRYLPDLERDVDCRTRVDLQDNPALHVALEPRKRGLQHVESKRQAGEDVVAGLIGDGSSFGSGGSLRDGNFDTRQNGARLVLDGAANLSGSGLRSRCWGHYCDSKRGGQNIDSNAF